MTNKTKKLRGRNKGANKLTNCTDSQHKTPRGNEHLQKTQARNALLESIPCHAIRCTVGPLGVSE